MRVYVHNHSILIIGRAREVLEQLRKQNQDFCFISEWIQNQQQK